MTELTGGRVGWAKKKLEKVTRKLKMKVGGGGLSPQLSRERVQRPKREMAERKRGRLFRGSIGEKRGPAEKKGGD